MVTTPVMTLKTQRSRISRTVQSLPPSGIRRFFDLVANTDDVISLGVGEPDFATPWRITEAGIHSLETGHTSYTSNTGLLQLRKEIAKYLQVNHQANYSPESELLVTVGGSEALDLSMRAVLEPGDEVIVLDPSFVSYAPLVSLAGGVPVRIATLAENAFSPTIEQLESALSDKTRALVINYPNNPTGAVITKEQAKEIADFVQKHDLFLISDEIYVPLTYEGDLVSLTSFEEIHDRLILIHGFSKAWAMTGWRLGFIAGPSDLVAAMTKIHQYTIMSASTTAQHAAIEALQSGDVEVEPMRREYDRRRRYFSHHLTDAGLTCFSPKGAFYVFPSIHISGLSSEDFAVKLLEEERVAVVPGTAFGVCGEGFVRCSYASSMDELREAAKRMERFTNRYCSAAS
jgi:aminotransferase